MSKLLFLLSAFFCVLTSNAQIREPRENVSRDREGRDNMRYSPKESGVDRGEKYAREKGDFVNYQTPESIKAQSLKRISVPKQGIRIFNPYASTLKVAVSINGTKIVLYIKPGDYEIASSTHAATYEIVYGSKKCSGNLDVNSRYDLVWMESEKAYCLEKSSWLVTE